MSSRGFVRISNLITPAHHAFDPLSKQEALDLVAGFEGLRASKSIDVSQASFFLDKTTLEELLTENRNGPNPGKDFTTGFQFDGLNVYFGLDENNKMLLLMRRASLTSKPEVFEQYNEVSQTMPVFKPATKTFELVDFASVSFNRGEKTEAYVMDVNDSYYHELRDNFKERFRQGTPELTVKLPPRVFATANSADVSRSAATSQGLRAINVPTLVTGYFLGKNALIDQLWNEEGNGIGIKFFLGYGSPSRNNEPFRIMHIIAIGAESADATIQDYPRETVWGTLPFSTARPFLTRQVSMDPGNPSEPPPMGDGSTPNMTSSCVRRLNR
jgi:hypothetical protein